jgi:hypothetical protein
MGNIRRVLLEGMFGALPAPSLRPRGKGAMRDVRRFAARAQLVGRDMEARGVPSALETLPVARTPFCR